MIMNSTLKLFLDASRYGSIPGNLEYGRLTWTDRARQQMANVVGFIRGLHVCGKTDEAATLAEALWECLTQLSSYGGEVENQAWRDGTRLEHVPRYRIVLGNDGTWGGFTLAWYAAITPERQKELRREDEDYSVFVERLRCNYGGEERYGPSYSRDIYYHLNRCEPGPNAEHIQIEGYTVNGVEHPPQDYWRERFYESRSYLYAYSFNGGLFYRGPGGDEVFSVSLGGTSLWTINT
jgi:hypothetical protein